MKTRAWVLAVFSSSALLIGCIDDPVCPYGTVMVHNGTSYDDGVCVTRYTPSRGAGTTTAVDAGSSTAAPAPTLASAEAGTGTGAAAPPATGTTTPPVTGTCGGLTAVSDSVRVVEKTEHSPVLADASSSVADGSYTLVQASFYRTGAAATPVRSLRAGLDVHGPTVTVNAQDTSLSGLPAESLAFLLASAGVVTKTCESVHGSISAWFFPFAVGGMTQSQLQYDSVSGIVRIIVTRTDGATELVFAR
jgi:hypothetical protein